MKKLNSIKDILWEDGVTTLVEYEARRLFYGFLSSTGSESAAVPQPEPDISEFIASISSDNSYMGSGGGVGGIATFGWVEGYDRGMRDYLKRGVESFSIYDN